MRLRKTMLTACKNITQKTHDVWLQINAPKLNDLEHISSLSGIPLEVLLSLLENSGTPRISKYENALLVIIQIPSEDASGSFSTIPITFILTPDHSITISTDDTGFLDGIRSKLRHDYAPQNPSRILFHILQQSGAEFASYIRKVRQRTDELEIMLRKAADNEQIHLLLNLEKGLTYITAALRGNIIVVEMLFRLSIDPKAQHYLHLQKEDEDLLESVILENKRALVTVETYSTILSSMMNAFSSVIANNLNQIMKFLASITIILSIPTVFSSFWSMSLAVPWQGTSYGFWLISAISLCAVFSAVHLLRQKKML